MKYIIKKHDVSIWFDKGVKDFFDNEYTLNTIGTMKYPASVLKRFPTDADKIKFLDALGNVIINAIVANPKGQILTSVEWQWLPDQMRFQLKQAVVNAVVTALLNPQLINEMLASSGVSSSNWSISSTPSNFVMKSDQLAMMANSIIKNSGVGKLRIEGDGFRGRAESTNAGDEIVLHEWDNTFLGKHLIDNDTSFEDFILNQVSVMTVDKYDYMTVKLGKEDEEKWRFEGFDKNNPDFWQRVDIQLVEGKQYLILDHVVLTGTKGDTGVLLFKGTIADKATLDAITNPKLNWTYVTQDTNKIYVYDGNQWVVAADVPAGLQGDPGKDGQSIYFRPSVANAAALPVTGNIVNDVRVTDDDKHWHGWNGTSWSDFGEITVNYTFGNGDNVDTQFRGVTPTEFINLGTIDKGGTVDQVLKWNGLTVEWQDETGGTGSTLPTYAYDAGDFSTFEKFFTDNAKGKWSFPIYVDFGNNTVARAIAFKPTEASTEMHFEIVDSGNMITFNKNPDGSFGSTTQSLVDTLKPAPAFADVDQTIPNQMWIVDDMAGQVLSSTYTFKNNEPGIVMVDSTGTVKMMALTDEMYKELLALTKRVDTLESKVNEHDNILKAIENTFLDALGDKNKFTAMAGGYGSLDISAITGSEGVFDYTKGKKLSIQIGMPYADHGYDEHTLTVGDPATGYSLTSADGTKSISFRLEVNVSGGLDVKDVVSNGIALSDLGIVSIQQKQEIASTGTPQDLTKYATIKEVLSDEAYFLMATAGQDTGVLRQIYFGDALWDRAAKIPTKSTVNPAGLVAGHQFAGSQFNIYTGLFSAFKELRTPGQTMTIRITNGDVLSVGYIFYSGNTGNVALNAFRVVPTDAVVNSVGLELSFSKPDDTHSEVSMSAHANYKFQEASLPLGPTITTDTIPTNWVDVSGNSIIIEDSAIFFGGDREKDWQKFFYDTRSAISAKPNSEKLMEITIQQYPEDAIKTLNNIDIDIWKAISALGGGTGGGTTPPTTPGTANFGDGNPTTDQPRALTQAEIDSIGTGGTGGTGVGTANFGDGHATTTQPKAVEQSEFDKIQTSITQADMDLIVGTLSGLTTVNKRNIVAAIDEINGKQTAIATGVDYKGKFADDAARDTAIPTPVPGDLALTGADSTLAFNLYDGAKWDKFQAASVMVQAFTYIKSASDTRPTLNDGETLAIYDDPTLDGSYNNKLIGVNAVGELEPVDKNSGVADGSIVNAKLATDSVSTDKIKDASITNAKIMAASVDTAKIKDGSITNAKLMDAQINNVKIVDKAIEEGKLSDAVVKKLNKTITLQFLPYTGDGHAATEGLWKVTPSDDWTRFKQIVDSASDTANQPLARATYTMQLRGGTDMRATGTFGVVVGGDTKAVGAGTAAALLYTGGTWQTQIKVVGFQWDWNGGIKDYMAVKASGEINNVWVELLSSPVYSNPGSSSWHLKTTEIIMTVIGND